MILFWHVPTECVLLEVLAITRSRLPVNVPVPVPTYDLLQDLPIAFD